VSYSTCEISDADGFGPDADFAGVRETVVGGFNDLLAVEVVQPGGGAPVLRSSKLTASANKMPVVRLARSAKVLNVSYLLWLRW
jgi:hypothetical protein